MALFKRIVLKDTVEINTTPDRIWKFWVNMDKNYKSWHPQDHILFRWTRGNPMEEGSKIYAEETVGGKLLKLKVTCMDVVPKRKFALVLPFPTSLFAKYEYLIEPRGAKTAFTAFTYLKYPGLARRRIELAVEVGKKHVREEGENLKKILEEEKP
ncbi:SRPBCC family protein [Chloroflexota bacterium]